MEKFDLGVKKAPNYYDNLASELKKNEVPFILSSEGQKEYGIEKNIFLPFDENVKSDTEGLGIYLFMHSMHGPKSESKCLVLTTMFHVLDEMKVEKMTDLLNEMNLRGPVPGWFFDSTDRNVFFKYIYPIENERNVSQQLLILLTEVYNTCTSLLPILVPFLEGKVELSESKEQIKKAFPN
jgi:hypothetical protein